MAVLYIAAVAAPQSSTRRNWNISVIWFAACVHGFHKDRWITVAQLCSGTDKKRKVLETMASHDTIAYPNKQHALFFMLYKFPAPKLSEPASVGEQPHSCLVYVMLPKNRYISTQHP